MSWNGTEWSGHWEPDIIHSEKHPRFDDIPPVVSIPLYECFQEPDQSYLIEVRDALAESQHSIVD